MALSSEVVEVITKGVVDREALNDPERIRGVNRIEIVRDEGLSYKASRPGEDDLFMIIDEPPERGGSGAGPSPLAHFLTGIGSCLLNQFIRISISERYDLEFTRMSVRGDYRRDVGGGFEHITQEVFATGAIDGAAMASLAERAEGFCYVHNTLNKAIKMTTVVNLNGEEVSRRVSEP